MVEKTLQDYILEGLKGKFFISNEFLLQRKREYKSYPIVYEVTGLKDDCFLIAKVYPDTDSFEFSMHIHVRDREATLEEVKRAKESQLVEKTSVKSSTWHTTPDKLD